MVADKSSMLAGVEIRIPLVTPTIFDYVFSMKLNVFLSLFVQKRPLLKMLKKQLSLKYFKRPKEGFNPDLENIVNKIGIDKLRNTLNDYKFSEIVSKTYVNKILIEHFNGKKNNSYKIYQLVYFRYWINCNS
jgi:asparagine synthase (glutamine-hydrolysing)